MEGLARDQCEEGFTEDGDGIAQNLEQPRRYLVDVFTSRGALLAYTLDRDQVEAAVVSGQMERAVSIG